MIRPTYAYYGPDMALDPDSLGTDYGDFTTNSINLGVDSGIADTSTAAPVPTTGVVLRTRPVTIPSTIITDASLTPQLVTPTLAPAPNGATQVVIPSTGPLTTMVFDPVAPVASVAQQATVTDAMQAQDKADWSEGASSGATVSPAIVMQAGASPVIASSATANQSSPAHSKMNGTMWIVAALAAWLLLRK